MTLEDQIKTYKDLAKQIEDLENQKKALSIEILKQVQDKCTRVNGYVVRRISRLLINVSMEDARMYQATKMEETVDKEKIKSLYQSGQPINGISEIEYIQIN